MLGLETLLEMSYKIYNFLNEAKDIESLNFEFKYHWLQSTDSFSKPLGLLIGTLDKAKKCLWLIKITQHSGKLRKSGK